MSDFIILHPDTTNKKPIVVNKNQIVSFELDRQVSDMVWVSLSSCEGFGLSFSDARALLAELGITEQINWKEEKQ